MLARLLAAATVLAVPSVAHAFCGFYVAPNDKPLVNDATMVALMRAGTRTALSMSNTYKGPPEDFAMVVPVPVVLQKENVKTLPLDLFGKLETLTAPRLVEYWEQDPCKVDEFGYGGLGMVGTGPGGGGMGYGGGGGGAVKIEAQFAVGEYEIVILSATESDALEKWLIDNKYKIPKGASAALAPYVKEQQKFFVAKVDSKKVKRDDKGTVTLSPLRVHYESSDFRLPVRLGLLNSAGAQDLIVFILGQSRFEAANYKNVFAPTNLDVIDDTRKSFGSFYAKLFDATLAKAGGKAVVTEYAWSPTSCDPCPGPNVQLSNDDLATLGADVLHTSGATKSRVVRMLDVGVDIQGKLAPEVIKRIVRANFPRFRVCYEQGLKKNPELKGGVSMTFAIAADGSVEGVKSNKGSMPDGDVSECVRKVFATMSFPEPDSGKVKVAYPIDFQTEEGSFGSPFPQFVVTRLHTRYSPDTLGDDLLFKSAEPIEGGREVRNEKGELSNTAKPSGSDTFQARYAIRHEWKGPIACEKPERGHWGGPWPEVKEPSSTVAAKDLAHTDRSGITLASYVKSGLDDLASLDKAAVAAPMPKDVPPTVPSAEPKKRACHCSVVGGDSNEYALAALGLLAVTIRLRRRGP